MLKHGRKLFVVLILSLCVQVHAVSANDMQYDGRMQKSPSIELPESKYITFNDATKTVEIYHAPFVDKPVLCMMLPGLLASSSGAYLLYNFLKDMIAELRMDGGQLARRGDYEEFISTIKSFAKLGGGSALSIVGLIGIVWGYLEHRVAQRFEDKLPMLAINHKGIMFKDFLITWEKLVSMRITEREDFSSTTQQAHFNQTGWFGTSTQKQSHKVYAYAGIELGLSTGRSFFVHAGTFGQRGDYINLRQVTIDAIYDVIEACWKHYNPASYSARKA